ncbi:MULTISPECIES: hypothetical protein [unclassified Nocardia]|uniref:hypothetical protein n=1 Tax=unclassified Nocardia TaxID=2637762 RepID=UPI001CE45ED6|nr:MULTISPECIES: hypothetical protein [unclassified Nocardia]
MGIQEFELTVARLRGDIGTLHGRADTVSAQYDAAIRAAGMVALRLRGPQRRIGRRLATITATQRQADCPVEQFQLLTAAVEADSKLIDEHLNLMAYRIEKLLGRGAEVTLEYRRLQDRTSASRRRTAMFAPQMRALADELARLDDKDRFLETEYQRLAARKGRLDRRAQQIIAPPNAGRAE